MALSCVVVFCEAATKSYSSNGSLRVIKAGTLFYGGSFIHIRAELWWEVEGQEGEERKKKKLNCEVQQFAHF